MARTPRRLLRVLAGRGGPLPGLLSVCPICFDQTGALTAGVSAGAAVLVVALAVILGAFARFAWRLSRSNEANQIADHRPRGLS